MSPQTGRTINLDKPEQRFDVITKKWHGMVDQKFNYYYYIESTGRDELIYNILQKIPLVHTCMCATGRVRGS